MDEIAAPPLVPGEPVDMPKAGLFSGPGNVGIGTASPAVSLHVVQQKPQSVLFIMDSFRIESCKPMPNRWRRFWYWALLGWKWEKI
jgi:hypothetical protein